MRRSRGERIIRSVLQLNLVDVHVFCDQRQSLPVALKQYQFPELLNSPYAEFKLISVAYWRNFSFKCLYSEVYLMLVVSPVPELKQEQDLLELFYCLCDLEASETEGTTCVCVLSG